MPAGSGPGQRVLHVQQADHALLILLPDAGVQRVQRGRHEIVEGADVPDHHCGLVDEPGPPPQEDLAADGEGDADEQHGGEGRDHHQLSDALPADPIELVDRVGDVEGSGPSRVVSLRLAINQLVGYLFDPDQKADVLSIGLPFIG